MGGSAASNVGVPTGRGPPPLGGIQTIGQSAAGIPSGGPAGGQAPSQAPTPGVQTQPPQGPAPTTTPPVHTPSPQEMGKQAHLQTQPASLQQVYVPAQNRPTSQVYMYIAFICTLICERRKLFSCIKENCGFLTTCSRVGLLSNGSKATTTAWY